MPTAALCLACCGYLNGFPSARGLIGPRLTLTIRYHSRGGRLFPDYYCQREGIEHGTPLCQRITGEAVDLALGELLMQAKRPAVLDVALAVRKELRSRLEELDRLRRKKVERAKYEADLAQRRY